MTTVLDARKRVARHIGGGGVAYNAPVVLTRINEALGKLYKKVSDADLTRRVNMLVRGNTVSLPWEFSRVWNVALNGSPRRLYHQTYELVEGGPGVVNAGGNGRLDLQMMGEWYATSYPMPVGAKYKLFAVSTQNFSGGTIRAYGKDESGKDIVDSVGIPGQEIRIAQWANGVEGMLEGPPSDQVIEIPVEGAQLFQGVPQASAISDGFFSRVDRVVLPSGRLAYVTLYAYDPVTNGMWVLSNYSPMEPNEPTYTWYRLLGACCDNESCVSAQAKLRFIPVQRDSDPIRVDLDAVEEMVKGIESGGDFNMEINREARATAMLEEARMDRDSGKVIFPVTFEDDIGEYPVGGFM